MACDPEVLKHVPLFALLDDEEAAVLAAQVEVRQFAPRQRIYKMGDPGGRAYVMVSGRVRVHLRSSALLWAFALATQPMRGIKASASCRAVPSFKLARTLRGWEADP